MTVHERCRWGTWRVSRARIM